MMRVGMHVRSWHLDRNAMLIGGDRCDVGNCVKVTLENVYQGGGVFFYATIQR